MRGGNTRFTKGQSGNPHGRPKKERPPASAFDVVFDQALRVTQNGIEREMTVEEALQLQTYQSALKAKKMAIRAVLKMIEKREEALAKLVHFKNNVQMSVLFDSGNANAAMELLEISALGEAPHGGGPSTRPLQVALWAAQAGLSRPGRRTLSQKEKDEIMNLTNHSHELQWPRQYRS